MIVKKKNNEEIEKRMYESRDEIEEWPMVNVEKTPKNLSNERTYMWLVNK